MKQRSYNQILSVGHSVSFADSPNILSSPPLWVLIGKRTYLRDEYQSDSKFWTIRYTSENIALHTPKVIIPNPLKSLNSQTYRDRYGSHYTTSHYTKSAQIPQISDIYVETWRSLRHGSLHQIRSDISTVKHTGREMKVIIPNPLKSFNSEIYCQTHRSCYAWKGDYYRCRWMGYGFRGKI